jgi:GH25 family lysozyme M1 (1,4-beta-N-acetylmuramidase)
MDFAHWEFWQYSETGRLKGVGPHIDMNCFYGNIEQLDKMTKK